MNLHKLGMQFLLKMGKSCKVDILPFIYCVALILMPSHLISTGKNFHRHHCQTEQQKSPLIFLVEGAMYIQRYN